MGNALPPPSQVYTVPNKTVSRFVNVLLVASFLLCVPAANWMIGHVGSCHSDGPCTVPVAPGLEAPSGVLVIGLAFVLRDLVQRRMGLVWSALSVIAGAVVSLMVAAPSLTVASILSYVSSETVDLLVFTALLSRGIALAVICSGVASAFVDSGLFVTLAFGNFSYLPGQFVGKIEAVMLALPLVSWLRRQASYIPVSMASN